MAKGKVYVRNTSIQDLYVTIIDRNTANGEKPWGDEKRLNEDESLPLECGLDGDYEANLEWVAKQVSDQTVTASGAEKVGDGGSLDVYAY